MVPGRYDITIYRGGTFSTLITAKDPEGVTMDFTKYTTMRMQIRPPWDNPLIRDSTPPLFELTEANGRLKKLNANLALEMNITAADTAVLPFTDGQYDFELVVEEEGVPDIVNKFLMGKVYVIGEVTV